MNGVVRRSEVRRGDTMLRSKFWISLEQGYLWSPKLWSLYCKWQNNAHTKCCDAIHTPTKMKAMLTWVMLCKAARLSSIPNPDHDSIRSIPSYLPEAAPASWSPASHGISWLNQIEPWTLFCFVHCFSSSILTPSNTSEPNLQNTSKVVWFCVVAKSKAPHFPQVPEASMICL